MIFDWQSEYHRYQHYLNDVGQFYARKRVRVYTEIALTILVINFFVFFAIKPTLITITGLLKETSDKKMVVTKLDKKISDLVTARNKYTAIEADLPLLDEALPSEPNVTMLVKQLEVLTRENGVEINSLQVQGVVLKSKENLANEDFLVFNLAVGGSYENLKGFLNGTRRLRRPILVESFTFTKSDKGEDLRLSINAKTKYMAEN